MGRVSERVCCCRRTAGLSRGRAGPFGDRPPQMRQEASCVRLSEAAELPPDSLTSVTCAQCEQGVRCFTPHSQSVCLAVWTETGTGPPPRRSIWALVVMLEVLLQGCCCATISSTFPGALAPTTSPLHSLAKVAKSQPGSQGRRKVGILLKCKYSIEVFVT